MVWERMSGHHARRDATRPRRPALRGHRSGPGDRPGRGRAARGGGRRGDRGGALARAPGPCAGGRRGRGARARRDRRRRRRADGPRGARRRAGQQRGHGRFEGAGGGDRRGLGAPVGLNVLGPWRLMRAVGPPMGERGWGRVVNVSSSAGKRPSSIGAAYSVTKAAELSLSRVFADAYAGRGVLVNAIAPGAVASELWVGEGGLADQRAAAADSAREEVLAAQGAKLPVGRMGTPEEIAAVIAFLCSERAAFVSGAAWSVDGGTVPGIL